MFNFWTLKLKSPELGFLGQSSGRTDFLWILIFGPPDFLADFFAGFFPSFLWGKVPRKSLAKSSKFYTTKIPDKFCKVARPRYSRCWITKAKVEKLFGILLSFVSVACCCGLCMPNMFIAKAHADENLGLFIFLSTTKAKARKSPQIFICNCFRVDGNLVGSEVLIELFRGHPRGGDNFT